jgi:hypothetical protein
MPYSTVASQTAMPEGRPISLSSMHSRYAVIRIDISCSRRRSSDEPRRQHQIDDAITPPMVRGNHPPLAIFCELAAGNALFTNPNSAIVGTVAVRA